MAIRSKIREGEVTDYKVMAKYKLFAHYFMRSHDAPTIEECREWVRIHPTTPIKVTFDAYKDATLVGYKILKRVLTNTIVESWEK